MALSLGMGIIGMALALGASSMIVEPLFDRQTAILVSLISPVFVVAAFHAVPYALLQRRLDFRTLAGAEVAGIIVGSSASVTLAALGAGAKSLVLGPLLGAGVAAVIAGVVARPPLPRIYREATSDIARFGVPLQLASLAWTLARNIDYAILAARLGPTATGYYWRAFQLGVEYQNKVGLIMLRVAFPIYSRSADQEQMNRMRRRLVRAHIAVVYPLLGLLIVVAPIVVPFVFGDQWEPAVGPTRILAVAGMIVAIGHGVGPLLLAAGRVHAILIANTTFLVTLAAAVYLAAPAGVDVTATAVVGVNLVFVWGTIRILLRPLGITERDLAADVAVPLLAIGPLIATALGVKSAMGAAGSGDLATLGVVSVAGLAVYGVLLRMSARETWSDLMLIASRRRRLTAPIARSGSRDLSGNP